VLSKTQTPLDTLAENVKELLKREGFSQHELARRARIKDPKNISNLCRGAHNPKLDTIEKIGRVFGLEAWELLRPGASKRTPERGETQRLVELYTAAPETARTAILQVAEMAAKYDSRD
jgi:transcriptional regulator with XRE-family HTH domain